MTKAVKTDFSPRWIWIQLAALIGAVQKEQITPPVVTATDKPKPGSSVPFCPVTVRWFYELPRRARMLES
jgi:hypothetical protein